MDIRRFLGRQAAGAAVGTAGDAQPTQEAAGPPGDDLAAMQPAATRVVQFSRKRSRNVEPQEELADALPEAGPQPAPAAAEPAAAAAAATAAAPLPAAPAPPGAARQRPRQLTQMFLDAGQRDFHAARCAQCGLMYSKGEESDEKLHAAFHSNTTKGLRYQGSQQERVVLVDGTRGRVVLLSGSEAARCKKVQELGLFLEEQMGLVKGWLLKTGGTVLLSVSAAKRIQACVVAEPVREAFAALAALPPEQHPHARSCASAAQPTASCVGREDASGPAEEAAAGGWSGAPVTTADVQPPMQPAVSVTRSSLGPADEQADPDRAADQPAEADVATAAAAVAGHVSRQAAAVAGPAPAEHVSSAATAGVASAAVTAVAAAGSGPAPPQPPRQGQALLVDRRQRHRAVCGVRLVWVSLEARRQGLATKLLDCLRSQFMQGYVIQRDELAYSQPTEAGAAFIRVYSGRRFLVYEEQQLPRSAALRQ